MATASQAFLFRRSSFRFGPAAHQETDSPPPRRGSGLVSGPARGASRRDEKDHHPSSWIHKTVTRKEDASDERLPDSVKLAKDRLLQRLRTMKCTGTRGATDEDPARRSEEWTESMSWIATSVRDARSDEPHAISSVLKKEVCRLEDDGDCAICLEMFLHGDQLTRLHCSHAFHSDCVEMWFRAHTDCPYCRSTVVFNTM